MEEEKLEELLSELADATAESPRPLLAHEIKEQIPQPFPHHRGLDTISIIIDLRISRVAVAAVIMITVILCASFLGGSFSSENNLYQNGKEVLRYWLGDSDRETNVFFLGKSELYKNFVPKDKRVIYYGDIIDAGDSDAIRMYWKVSNGTYRVIFGDLSTRSVSTEELIELHTKMLKKKHNK